MWITDFILNSSITYKMELENILSPKNQTFAYVIKEFDKEYLYKCKKIFQKSFDTSGAENVNAIERSDCIQ